LSAAYESFVRPSAARRPLARCVAVVLSFYTRMRPPTTRLPETERKKVLVSASRTVSARRSFVLLQLLLVAALLVVLSAGATSITGDNVLVNGDAEASPGVAPIDNSGVAPPDGWRVTGSFTAI
jgi:hypothetical protein